MRTALAYLCVLGVALLWGCEDGAPSKAEPNDGEGESGDESRDLQDEGLGGGEEDQDSEEENLEPEPDTDEVQDTMPDFEMGEPLPDQKNGEWKFITVGGAICRNGSKAGFYLRRNDASKNLLIAFGFGGACFNTSMCALTSTAEIDLLQTPRNLGVFDSSNKDNPVKDFNMISIPYCTGDVHAGSRRNVSVDGVLGKHDFVGGDNYRLFLKRIAPTFLGADKVVLTGYSAGGFGATFNAVATQKAFGPATSIVIIPDGAPALRDDYLAPCLMQKLRNYWDLDEYLSETCDGCINEDGSGIYRILEQLKAQKPGISYGVISSYEDFVIRMFFSYGLDNCSLGLPIDYSGSMYTKAMLDYKDYLVSLDWGGTFYFNGSEHGRILFPSFYTSTVDGVRLVDWFKDVMDGNMYHVSPK